MRGIEEIKERKKAMEIFLIKIKICLSKKLHKILQQAVKNTLEPSAKLLENLSKEIGISFHLNT